MSAGAIARVEVVQTEEARRRAVIFVPVAKDAGEAVKIRTALAKAARVAGLDVAGLVEEHLGKAGARTARAALLLAAYRVEVALLPSLASLGANTNEILSTVMGLAAVVEVKSVAEPWLNLSTESSRLLAVWVLDRERERRSQTIREAQSRARSFGRNVGRPRITVDLAKAEVLLASGMTVAAVARACGCGTSTLRRVLASVRAPTSLVFASPPAAPGAP